MGPKAQRTIWVSATIVALAIVFHAAIPRYEWRIEEGAVLRFDRWTGSSVAGRYGRDSRWIPIEELRAQQELTEREAEASKAASKKAATEVLEKAIAEADKILNEKPSTADDPVGKNRGVGMGLPAPGR